MIDRGVTIEIDIDKERLREIVTEALRMIYEYLGGEYIKTKEDVLAELDSFITTDRISTEFFLHIGSRSIPDLKMRVDPRRRKVFMKSSFRKKVAKLNYFVKLL
jgi:hypothetical protein